MSALIDFLIEESGKDIVEEVVLSERLKGKPFKIGIMDSTQHSGYQQAATSIKKGKKIDFNEKLFNESVIINHCIEPNFKDAEFIGRAGCATPGQCLNKVLRAGEVSTLSRKIMELSGFLRDDDELASDAKNS